MLFLTHSVGYMHLVYTKNYAFELDELSAYREVNVFISGS